MGGNAAGSADLVFNASRRVSTPAVKSSLRPPQAPPTPLTALGLDSVEWIDSGNLFDSVCPGLVVDAFV